MMHLHLENAKIARSSKIIRRKLSFKKLLELILLELQFWKINQIACRILLSSRNYTVTFSQNFATFFRTFPKLIKRCSVILNLLQHIHFKGLVLDTTFELSYTVGTWYTAFQLRKVGNFQKITIR